MTVDVELAGCKIPTENLSLMVVHKLGWKT